MGMLNQPSNQIRFTNVSIVRMKKGKKRFEIACYKNKVLEWRNGNEKDVDNVLQIHNVFLNVSKGKAASSQELAKAFGPDRPRQDIILDILANGDLQVGNMERTAQLERIHNEVVAIIASKLIDPRSKRVYTTSMIAKALEQLNGPSEPQDQENDAENPNPSANANTNTGAGAAVQSQYHWTGVVTTRSAKSQALDGMRALISQQPLPVMRARMRLRLTCPAPTLKQRLKAGPAGASAPVPAKADADEGKDKDGQEERPPLTLKDAILSHFEQILSQDTAGTDWEVTGFVEPGAFRTLSELLNTNARGKGHIEVLDAAVKHTD